MPLSMHSADLKLEDDLTSPPGGGTSISYSRPKTQVQGAHCGLVMKVLPHVGGGFASFAPFSCPERHFPFDRALDRETADIMIQRQVLVARKLEMEFRRKS